MTGYAAGLSNGMDIDGSFTGHDVKWGEADGRNEEQRRGMLLPAAYSFRMRSQSWQKHLVYARSAVSSYELLIPVA